MRSDVAGRDITRHLQLLLRREGHIFKTSSEFEIVRQMKEVPCCAAFSTAIASWDKSLYCLLKPNSTSNAERLPCHTATTEGCKIHFFSHRGRNLTISCSVSLLSLSGANWYWSDPLQATRWFNNPGQLCCPVPRPVPSVNGRSGNKRRPDEHQYSLISGPLLLLSLPLTWPLNQVNQS